jgi:hypothetical protein
LPVEPGGGLRGRLALALDAGVAEALRRLTVVSTSVRAPAQTGEGAHALFRCSWASLLPGFLARGAKERAGPGAYIRFGPAVAL